MPLDLAICLAFFFCSAVISALNKDVEQSVKFVMLSFVPFMLTNIGYNRTYCNCFFTKMLLFVPTSA